MTPVPAFTRLPQVAHLPRGFSAACRAHALTPARITSRIHLYSICAANLDFSNAAAPAVRTTAAWLNRFLANLDMSINLRHLVEPAYLVFKSVREHSDGPQPARDSTGLFAQEEHFFLNVQLAGTGRLIIAGQKHRIVPGDAYVLDQRLPHEWVAQGECRSRALSFALPQSVLERVFSR